jgi:hypothetical protein
MSDNSFDPETSSINDSDEEISSNKASSHEQALPSQEQELLSGIFG